jgi:hypothetical protein
MWNWGGVGSLGGLAPSFSAQKWKAAKQGCHGIEGVGSLAILAESAGCVWAE